MNKQKARGPNSTPWRRLAAAGSTGGLAGVALLMVLAAASQGAVGPGVVLTKPYKGFVSAGNSVYHLGCGPATVAKAATFSKTSGMGVFSMHTTAPKCAFTQGNGGYSYNQLTVYVPIALSAGNHNVTINWTIAVAGTETFTLGKCVLVSTASYSSCYQEGMAYLDVYTFVVDSNGTSYYPITYWPGFFNETYNDTYCYSGKCYYYSYGGASGSTGSFSGTTTFAWIIPLVKVPAGHHFYAVSELYGGAASEAQPYNAAIGGSFGSASVNFATLGNGGTLNSITVA